MGSTLYCYMCMICWLTELESEPVYIAAKVLWTLLLSGLLPLSVCLSVSICLCSICLFDCLCASITSIASVCLSVSLSVCVHQSRSVFSVGSDLNVFLLNTSVSMYSKCYIRIWKCSTAVLVIVHMCQSASTDVFATVTDFSG